MLLLVDCPAVGYRSAYKIDLEHDGARTGVIFGFLRTILDLAKQFEGSDFAFLWDSKRSVRMMDYPAYKEDRKKDPNKVKIKTIAHPQFDLLRKEILPGMGFSNVFHQPGMEADDLIAAICHENELQDDPEEIVIVSNDEDLYQLLSVNCSMYKLSKGTMYTLKDFQEEYEIPAPQWAYVKAIGGCSTDNVAGVVGVGEKTAARYIKHDLKPNSKAYLNITSDEGRAIEERNLPLVSLPHEDTDEEALVLMEDELDIRYFKQMLREYGFTSMRKALDDWRRFVFKKKPTKRMF